VVSVEASIGIRRSVIGSRMVESKVLRGPVAGGCTTAAPGLL
jgi:hypothetical protein